MRAIRRRSGSTRVTPRRRSQCPPQRATLMHDTDELSRRRFARREFLAASALLIAAVVVPARRTAVPGGATAPGTDIRRLARQYRAYRRALRADTQRTRTDLRAWDGPMHRVRAELGECVSRGRYTRRRLERLMGPPDEVRTVSSGF